MYHSAVSVLLSKKWEGGLIKISLNTGAKKNGKQKKSQPVFANWLLAQV